MSEKTVVITETVDGEYELQNNGMSEFALIGLLECVLFDLKFSNKRAKRHSERSETTAEEQTKAAAKESMPAPTQNGQEIRETKIPDLRTRIGNAVKAIRNLGGEIAESNLTDATDEELQSELEELTNQYKRLKNSKSK
jgi:hypothetical protein